jgi:hypothetical protein
MCAAILVAIPKCNSRDVTEMFTTHDLLTILLEPDCPRSLVQVAALVVDEEVLLAFFVVVEITKLMVALLQMTKLYNIKLLLPFK